MKNIIISFFLLAITFFFTSCEKYINYSNYGLYFSDEGIDFCKSETWSFLTAETTDVGTLTVANDDQNVYITYNTSNNFNDIHLWLGTDTNEIPRNSQDFINLGHFPYFFESNNMFKNYTFVIPFYDISNYNQCGEEIFIIAQANVLIEGEEVWETAFGGDNLIEDNGWYYFANYAIGCCDIPNPPITEYEELGTAFAKGNWIFASNENANPDNLPSLELSNNLWGWAININEAGSYDYELWIDAGLNDTSKGTLVGNVNVDFTGSQVTVTYNLDDTYSIGEAHVYASDFSPTTTAPGQFGNVYEFDDLQTSFTDTYDVSDTDDDGIWLIVHAIAFGELTE